MNYSLQKYPLSKPMNIDYRWEAHEFWLILFRLFSPTQKSPICDYFLFPATSSHSSSLIIPSIPKLVFKAGCDCIHLHLHYLPYE